MIKSDIYYYLNVDIGTIINMTSSPSSEHVDNISEINELSGKMECVHVQRIPTNTKVVLVADIDKDGANEMILGLTDRVVRSYRWSSSTDFGTGRLVGLNKWECANQIGTVTLQVKKKKCLLKYENIFKMFIYAFLNSKCYKNKIL